MYDEILKFAQDHLGLPYIWGGAGLPGPDCSGLLEWATNVLAPGMFPGRQVAASWYNLLPKLARPVAGGTGYLRSQAGNIFHVVVIEKVEGYLVHVIGANGGGSWCTTPEIARKKGAAVKRAVYNLSSFAGFRGWPSDVHPHVAKVEADHEPMPHTNEGEPPEGWV